MQRDLQISPFNSNASVEEINLFLSKTVEDAYSEWDNDLRRRSLETLCAIEEFSERSPDVATALLRAGLSLLPDSTASERVRAYAATILRHLVVGNSKDGAQGTAKDATPRAVTSFDIPYVEIAAWAAQADTEDNIYKERLMPSGVEGPPPAGPTAPTLGSLLVQRAAELVAECALRSWTAQSNNLVDIISPSDGSLARMPNMIRFLLAFCLACTNKGIFTSLQPGRGRTVSRAFAEIASRIVKSCVNALSVQFQFISGRLTAGTQEDELQYVARVCSDMVCCLQALTATVFVLPAPLRGVVDEGVQEALTAIVGLEDAAAPLAQSLCGPSINAVIDEALVLAARIAEHITPSSFTAEDLIKRGSTEPHVQQLKSLFENLIITMEPAIVGGRYTHAEKLLELAAAPGVRTLIDLTDPPESVLAADLPKCTCDPFRYANDSLARVCIIAARMCLQLIPSVKDATSACRLLIAFVNPLIEHVAAVTAQPQTTPLPAWWEPLPNIAALSKRVNNLGEAVLKPGLLLEALATFANRRNYDPWFSTESSCTASPVTSWEALSLNEEQCVTREAFIGAYSEFRASASTLLEVLSLLFPLESLNCACYTIQHALRLPVAQGEPRSETGNVKQSSCAYAAWESADFLIGIIAPVACLSPLAGSEGSEVAPRLSASLCASRQSKAKECERRNLPDDGVGGEDTLVPPWINIWLSICEGALGVPLETANVGTTRSVPRMLLLVPELPTTQNWAVAEEAVSTFIYFMNKQPRERTSPSSVRDLDLLSARKRGYTALLSFCTRLLTLRRAATPEGTQLCNRAAGEVMHLLSQEFTSPSETQFAYEILGALATLMHGEARERTLREVLERGNYPLEAFIAQLRAEGPSAALVPLFCGGTKDANERRESLIASVGAVVGVLRRCDKHSGAQAAATSLPLLVELALALHELRAEDFPAEFASILDPVDEEQRVQMLKGGGSRDAPDYRCRSSNARRSLNSLKTGTYAGVALFPTFLDAEEYSDVLCKVVSGGARMTPGAFKTLLTACFIPLTEGCKATVSAVLETSNAFLRAQHSRRSSPPRNDAGGASRELQQVQLSDEVVHGRIMLHISRDLAALLRATIVEGISYADSKRMQGPGGAVGSSQGRGAKPLERYRPSAKATFPCLEYPPLLSLAFECLFVQLKFGFSIYDAAAVGMTLLARMLPLAENAEASGEVLIRLRELFALLLFSTVTGEHCDRPHARETACSHLAYFFLENTSVLAPALTQSYVFISRPGGGSSLLPSYVAEALTARKKGGWAQRKDEFVSAIYGAFEKKRGE